MLSNTMIRQLMDIGGLASDYYDGLDGLANFIEIANNPNVGLYMVHNARIDIEPLTRVIYTFDSDLIITYDIKKGISVKIGELDAEINDYDAMPENNYCMEFINFSKKLIAEHDEYIFLSI